jgi:dihydroorotase
LSGLEFAFPATYALVRAGHLSLSDLVRLWTVEPASILAGEGDQGEQEHLGTLTVGAPADIAVFDPDMPWTVTADALRTKSANTPLLGMTLRGRSVLTLVNGEARYHV